VTEVLVAGGGPVGMVLAAELSLLGVDTMVLDQLGC
jgi:2-polyprenyl-6-methoxyphenol hydroxylase-like FAD-dependent oxidoreductase